MFSLIHGFRVSGINADNLLLIRERNSQQAIHWLSKKKKIELTKIYVQAFNLKDSLDGK